jgi:hypothetical protein
MSKGEERTELEKYTRKCLFYMLPGIVIIAIIFAFVIPDRYGWWMNVAAVAYAVIAMALILRGLFKRIKTNPAAYPPGLSESHRKSFRKGILFFRIMIAVITLCTIVDLWSKRGQPLLPQIEELGGGLLVLAIFILGIRTNQRLLKQNPDDKPSQEPPSASQT